ncbi:PIG-L deacetylase family protein [Xylophilus sp.]|uniref:PIG-L deacetylase family protein n=1 Tax=Xylophilus sp. TaxID=2653893 RepID=UPI0013B65EE8|nr:PIG-L family deacetylase [Xylophilus sp.]KAF1049870.1 MAG: hypothetical protein GAK38_00534 [Xylophilus sp.]
MAAVIDGAAPRIQGRGTPAAAWRRWPGWAGVPVAEAAQLVPAGGRAVIVAPHPDDEVIGTGVLQQALAAAGRGCRVVAVTDGDASHPGSGLWTRAELAAGRRGESARAAAVLGLPQAACRLHLPDGGVAAQEATLARRLAALLEPADTVFATWRHDGHPDHEAVGRAAAAAARMRGARLVEVPVWCWHWSGPGDPRLPWHRARRLAAPAQALRRKQQALACFRSQLLPDPTTGAAPILPAWALQRWAAVGEVFFA